MRIITSFICLFLILSFYSRAQNSTGFLNREAVLSASKLQITQPMIGSGFAGDNINVVYHRAYWEIDPTEVYIKGAITSYFKPTAPQVSTISFDLSDSLHVDSVLYHQQLVDFQRVVPNQVEIVPGMVLPEEVLDSLTIFYQGIPQIGNGHGSFEQGFHDGVPVVWTFSQPYGSGDWWPCKNDLSDKIDSLDIFVKTPLPNRVASVGLLVDSIPDGDQTIYHWRHRYPVAACLIGIAVTNYVSFSDFVEIDGRQLEVLNYVYPEELITAREQARGVLPIITLFCELFTPYPFLDEKYGQAMFGHPGGVQTQTMGFFSSFSFHVMAHELSHMWFCNYVTAATWREIWLNEGFASYCTGLSYEHLNEGYWWPIWKTDVLDFIISEPGGSVYVYDTTDVFRVYDPRLTYHKGAFLVHMIRWVLGDGQFYQAIRNYLNDPGLANGYATTQDLKNHLEAVSGLDLTEFFDVWFYGEGFPSYYLNCSIINETQMQVTIEQTQSHPSVEFFKMPVPVKFYGPEKDTTIVFDHRYTGQEFLIDPGFVPDSLTIDPEMWLISGNNHYTLGVNELNEQTVTISPNPVKEILNLSLEKSNAKTNYQIFDISGNTVLTGGLNRGQASYRINVSNLPTGNYLLRVEEGDKRFSRKFIKQ